MSLGGDETASFRIRLDRFPLAAYAEHLSLKLLEPEDSTADNLPID